MDVKKKHLLSLQLSVPNTKRTPSPRQSPKQARPPPRPAPPSPRPVALAQGFEPPPPYTPSPQPCGAQLPPGGKIVWAYKYFMF